MSEQMIVNNFSDLQRTPVWHCWLVGGKSLLRQFAEALSSRGHRIVGLSSPNPDLRQWASEHGLAATDSAALDEIRPALGGTALDFIFSIYNDELLRPEVLALPRLAAVNFHDGPLPRYAGVHSTTWALINREPVHGVTWHVMTPGVDDGPILKQRPMPIAPDETAFTLNLKAYQTGLETFIELIDELSWGLPQRSPQDLTQRTLFPRFKRPPNGLVISWDRSAAEIEAFCRALDFGPHPNPIGTPKMAVNGMFAIIRELSVLNSQSGSAPGTILDCEASALTVATATNDVQVTQLLTIDGAPLALADLSQREEFAVGSCLEALSPETQTRLTAAYTLATRQESYWVDQLVRFAPARLPESIVGEEQADGTGWGEIALKISDKIAEFLAQNQSDWTLPELAIAAFAAYLKRLGVSGPFRIGYLRESERETWRGFESIFTWHLPLAVELTGDESLQTACCALRDRLREIGSRGVYARDLAVRYPSLSAPWGASFGDVCCEITTPGRSTDRVASAPLTLSIAETGLSLRLVYDRAVLSDETATRLGCKFERFLEAVIERPTVAVKATPLLDESELRKVLYEWNETRTDYPLEKCVPDLIGEQVRLRPDATAAVCCGRRLTYSELNRRAAQLAVYLNECGVESGTMVAVFIDRSLEMLVALLGILKAGGTYLPLDPIYPQQRLAHMLDDAGVKLIITETPLAERVREQPLRKILIDRDWSEIERASAAGDGLTKLLFTHEKIRPENIAYVIYTSGSTGLPKGVPIEHRSMTNLMLGLAAKTGFSDRDSLYALSTICFDFSVLDLFLPLVCGGWLEILPTEVTRDGQKLRETVESGEVTYIEGTPGAWRLMLAGGWSRKRPLTVISSGEVLSRELADRILERAERLFAAYGPTETTVLSSADELFPGERVTIGRPLPNYRHYVLDQQLNPVGVGEVGEICIAGVSVSPGYLNRPEINREKFLPDPFCGQGEERLYRSGDLGRFLPNGQIEFLDRNDLQVKLRGFRIELGEIEATILRNAAVQDAVVVLREEPSGQQRLVAFVVVKEGARASFDPAAFGGTLQEWLPEYMIPAQFIVLQSLPNTLSHKIDRKWLSSSALKEITASCGEHSYQKIESESPRKATAEEERLALLPLLKPELAAIFGEILGVAPGELDPRSHIGELGFDSIQLTSLAFRLGRELGMKFEVTTFYRHPSLEKLAAYLAEAQVGVLRERYQDRLAHPRAGLSASTQKIDHEVRPSLEPSPPLDSRANDPIAVIGMAGRFPGARDLDHFWAMLKSGKSFVTESPATRWVGPPQWGGFIEGIDQFDAKFFGISPREAELMDPQQRLLLETLWHALEDAGQRPSALSGRRVGVFIGGAAPDYEEILRGCGEALAAYPITGITASLTANRLSYVFNFLGPSEGVDTGCSSSLVATHRALAALERGECELAIAGGVNLLLSPTRFIAQAHEKILSPDGKVRPFDKDANGIVRGEGVGLVILKRLSLAERDEDPIYAVIRGSAVGHAGRTTSLAGPNPAAQAQVIAEALRRADVAPASITYIEAQGSGAPQGDALEIAAYQEAFRGTDLAACGIGSIKPNIGHLETAAGIASLFKVILALRYQTLPATIHFDQLNPQIELDGSPFYIQKETAPWRAALAAHEDVRPRRAGVHGFGFGGTCAHLVVEEYLARATKKSGHTEATKLFLFSARSAKSLDETVRAVAEWLSRTNNPALADVAYTLRMGREEMEERLAILANSQEELLARLQAYLAGGGAHEGARRGAARRALGLASIFADDPDAEVLLRAWIEKGKWEKLADLWVKGASIDWARLPLAPEAQRVSLPGYQFDHQRFWPAPPALAEEEKVADDTKFFIASTLAQLLGISPGEIRPDEDLRGYGFDSLVAMRLINRIEDRLGQRLTLVEVYNDPTIQGLAARLPERLLEESSPGTNSVAVSGAQDAAEKVVAIFPLSEMQKLIWMADQLAPGGYAYNCPAAFLLDPGVNIPLLEQALDALGRRHETLRTSIQVEDGAPVQIVSQQHQIRLAVHDVSSLAEAEVIERIREDGRRPFDLAAGPLARASIYITSHTTGARPILLLTLHHVISDGLSFEILLAELREAYALLASQRGRELEQRRPPSYQAFVEWQRQLLAGEQADTHRAFWRQQLPRGIPPLELVTDRPRPATPRHRGAMVMLEVGAEQWRQVVERGLTVGVTPFTVCLATFYLLLHRLTQQEEIVIAVPVAGRQNPDFESTVGLLMNLVPACGDLTGDPSVAELWRRTQQAFTAALDHSALPLTAILDVVRASGKRPSQSPFQVAFYGQTWRVDETRQDALGLQRIAGIQQEGEFDLTIEIVPEQERCLINFKYDPDLFDESTVQRLASYYRQALEGSITSVDGLCSSISLLDQNQRRLLLTDWNETTEEFPLDRRVPELFKEQVRQNPQAIAVLDGSKSLAYHELDHLSDVVANSLRRMGVGANSLVGVLLDRSAEMLTGLLGVLKIGAAYVPLDPTFPRQRLDFMVADSGLTVVLTHTRLAEITSDWAAKILLIDADAEAGEEPEAAVDKLGHGLAYVIYTSGSTGEPKGTYVLHRGLTNLLLAMAKQPGMTGRDHLLALTTISFDIAALELFLPLITGGVVEIVSAAEARDGARLRRRLESSAANIIQATPATYRMLLAAGWERTSPLKILCGGEALAPDLAERLLLIGEEVWNLYGPTEATIWCCAWRVEAGRKITIGRPIANTQIFILDQHLSPVPIGVVGELYVGGAGLAQGYHARPELTRSSFILNPFDGSQTARLYRTGDRARYLPDGNIELLGRNDSQVKLRGVRIELGEIENALRRIASVQDAAAVLRQDKTGQDQLVAFIVRRDNLEEPATPADYEQTLRTWLPDAMLPAAYVHLTWLPQTPNRKLDRRALAGASLDELKARCGAAPDPAPRPDPEQAAREGQAEPALRAEVERAIARIVGALLNESAERLDSERHLGEYGLDSIRFTSLGLELTRAFAMTVEPPLFYQYSTLRRLSDYFLAAHPEQMKRLFATKANGAGAGLVSAPVSSRNGDGQGQTLPLQVSQAADEPIAIIGVGGVFPGSADLDEFWDHLWRGSDLITEIPPDRWAAQAIYGGEDEPGKTNSKWGSFVEDVDCFDAAFFGISPREAEQMDPQQRLLLRAIWRMFEDAGYRPAAFAGSRCGVYIGASGFDFNEFLWSRRPPIAAHTLSGLSHAILANRLSYLFDLRGPSASIDTACSSSLVAIHRAVSAIRSGQCRTAIAGGVSVILSPSSYVALSQTKMLSPQGRCKTFASTADGYVRGEGAALLLLKPLSQAQADGDRVQAVILGSAENHGGRTNSLTAPNPNAQAELLVEAYSAAGIDPRTVTYLETHGTGTALGDPIEINGLKAAFELMYRKWNLPPPSRPHCGIGSLKTNIGHLEAAAGVAGVVKVVLAMRHGKLPGLLHNHEVNPLIHLEGSSFYLVRANETWNSLAGDDGASIPRRAGVSSFGFGGANAHVVLEEYLATQGTNEQPGGPALIVLSAADSQRLEAQCRELVQFLERRSPLGSAQEFLHDLAYTLQVGRVEMAVRLALIVSSLDELKERLQTVTSAPGARPLVISSAVAAGGALERLAHQWVSGGSVDWSQAGLSRRRIALPGHPFERVRYWLSPYTADRLPVSDDAPAAAPKLRLRTLEAVNQPESLPVAAGPIALANWKTRAELVAALKNELASVLYVAPSVINDYQSFVEFGVDSILGIEFARKVGQMTGSNLRATDLYDHPSLARLAEFLMKGNVVVPDSEDSDSSPQSQSGDKSLAGDVKRANGLLREQLTKTLAQVLYLETGKVATTKAFVDLGLDSILAVEFVRELNRQFGLGLSASILYDYPDVEKLTHYLETRLLEPAAQHQPEIVAAAQHQAEMVSVKVEVEAPPTAAPRASQQVRSRDIAIIGCSGRFPGAADINEFWANLAAGVSSIVEIPKERWSIDQYYDPVAGRPGKSISKWGGFITDVDKFDPLFFNISPSEAELMDPQQRLFLQEAWRAIEDAGYSDRELAQLICGVYVGVTGSDRYRELLPATRPAQEMLGNAHSILAGRLAFFLDLKGPAITVDTACSSSLVAIHLACQSLLASETDLAIAGGITLYLTEAAYIEMSHAGMLAPDGRCKAFDDRADGFVPGEGIGVVVLKPLEKAIADGDHIYAVIRGSGVNQDGRTNGLTAPSAKAQAALETQVYRQAGVNPETITLVEAHGTGTKLGDPIEVEALTRAFREWTARRQFCALGSVKTNIGHTTAAAGVAGLIKIIQSLRHRKLPPTLHYERENEHLRLAESPFFINTSLGDWHSAPDEPRRAAISSFGFSGTNCHLVLEEAPALAESHAAEEPWYFIPLSAKTIGSLKRRIEELADYLEREGKQLRLRDLAYTLIRGRAHFPCRVALVVQSLDQLRRELRRAQIAAPAAPTQDPLLQELGTRLLKEIASRQSSVEELQKKLATIADLYGRGYDLDWAAGYEGGGLRRLALPTYPFETEHCWAAQPPPAGNLEKPRERQMVIHRIFPANDPVIKGHRLEGEAIVPATALLEVAIEAYRALQGDRRAKLVNAFWVRPIVITGLEQKVRISFEEDGATLHFRIETGPPESSVLHAEGSFEPETAEPAAEAERLDVGRIEARLGEVINSDALYLELESLGVSYGPALRGLERIRASRTEALGYLRPSAWSDGEHLSGLHPAVLDAALQTTAALTRDEQGRLRSMLPFAVDQLVFRHALSPNGLAYVQKVDEGRFDVTITDAEGLVCLKLWGFTLRPPRANQGPASAFATTAATGLPSIKSEDWRRQDSARAELNRIARRSVFAPLQDMGLIARFQQEGNLETVVRQLGILPDYLPLLDTLLEMLSREGLLTSSGATISNRTVESRQQWEEAVVRFPELQAPLTLLERCISALPEVLTGRRRALEVLFPDGSFQLVEAIYRENHLANYCNRAVAEVIRTFVAQKRRHSPGARIEILEVGAGTGATSETVLEAIAALNDEGLNLRYVYSDVSLAFVEKGRAALGGRYPFAEFTLLDLERDPTAQGFKPSGFDVVCGTNVLHATSDVRRSLGFISRLLQAGGLLVINEATRVDDFAVLTFGLSKGWWSFRDGDERLKGSPLISAERWTRLLEEAGFRQSCDLMAGDPSLADSGQAIFVAEKSSAQQRESSYSDGELWRETARYVKRTLSKILKLDPARFENQVTFEAYGIDSLVVLDITKEFEKDLGRLPSTLLFENMTIEALTNHFLETRGEVLEKLLGQPARPIAQPTPVIPAQRISRETSPTLGIKTRAEDGIAIIAVAGRYPLSPTLDDLWENLKAGRHCIREVPDKRWEWVTGAGDERLGAAESAPRRAGFIDDVDKFDPLFFGISPREAAAMDPQQRLFLETSAALLQEAGYTRRRLAALDFRVGVFVGVMTGDYEWLAAEALARGVMTDAHAAYWSIANRVSYFFNLQGPSLAVDTACSSSLTAIHLACESLRNGECRAAIAGGVNLILHPVHTLRLARAGMLSSDDRCKSFGAGADGFVDGEGVGAVLLKPLGRALADGDRIWGVIKGSAINAGGKTSGYTVPNPAAQAEVVSSTLQAARIDPRTITFVEAHGTGTSLGDPIEIAGLAQAFGGAEHRGWCAISSAKSNFGHLEAAAGILGLTKVLLQFKHRMLVPSLHAEVLNPHIDFANSPFRVQQDLAVWRRPESHNGAGAQLGPLRAGISSFGAGGSNAHLILEEFAQGESESGTAAENPQLILFSARNREQLDALLDQFLSFLRRRMAEGRLAEEQLSLDNIAYTLMVGREAMDERLALIVSNPNELLERLNLLREERDEAVKIFRGNARSGSRTRLLEDDEDALEIVERWISKGKLDKLAELWVGGTEIDWTRLSGNQGRQVTSLPSYPFAREHYWIGKSPAKVEQRRSIIEPQPAFNLSLDENLEEKRLLYLPRWVPQELRAASERGAGGGGVVVVLLPPEQGFETLATALAQAHAGSQAVVVRLGTENRVENGILEIRSSDLTALEQSLSQVLPVISHVYHLGGLQRARVQLDDLAALGLSQEVGIISLFRLAKALRRAGPRVVNLAILTNGVHQIGGDDNHPFAASLHGFVRSMRKEYTDWRICSVDIDVEAGLQNAQTLAAAIRAEFAHQGFEDIAFRQGRRYARTISPLEAPPPLNTAFRERGVYLILGGGGGLGRELAAHLAATVRARIALIGRRRLNQEQMAQIAEIERRGGQVLYLEADATDPLSLEQAVAKVRERFGPIQGAIHSALVLRDRTIDRMDEATLREVMAPKVQGSVALYRALRGEPLDFLLFFSSAQSFSGDAGQSNYAAACSFKDAYAQALGARTTFPVKIINWGYWGTVGVVASEDYRARLAARGIHSISPPQGMRTIEWLLSEPRINQAMAISSDQTPLIKLGVNFNELIVATPNTADSSPLCEWTSIALTADNEKRDRFRRAQDEMERFGRVVLVGVLRRMGAPLGDGARFELGAVERKLGVAPRHKRLFATLFEMFVRQGWLERREGGYVALPTLDAPRFEAQFNRAHEIKSDLVARFPEIEAHLALLLTCLDSYPEVLTGKRPPTDILFPNASMERVTRIYQGNAVADYSNELIAHSVRAYVLARLAQLGDRGMVRILEVGAGTGGTSATVLRALAELGDRVEYIYSDISPAFLQHGRASYGAHYPFVAFRQLDIAADPIEQGLDEASFDIVLAANVIHATSDLRESIARVKALLRTNGRLILNEAIAVEDFLTLTFGLLDGWWLAQDLHDRIGGSPLASSATWQRLLQEEGFEPINVGDSTGDSLAESVIIARSDGLIRRVVERVVRAKPEPIRQIQAAPADDIKHQVQQVIQASLSEVLELETSKLDTDTPHTDFGIDSILAVEVINRINRRLDIRLRTTDLYNFSTIERLTQQIIAKFGDKLRSLSIPSRVNGGGVPTEAPAGEKKSGETKSSEDEHLLDLLRQLSNGQMSVGEAVERLNGSA